MNQPENPPTPPDTAESVQADQEQPPTIEFATTVVENGIVLELFIPFNEMRHVVPADKPDSV